MHGERPFDVADTEYRAIARETAAGDFLMSHASVHFDRTGSAEDVDVVFPIGRFRELEASGAVGSTAGAHDSFMGACVEPAGDAPSAAPAAAMPRCGSSRTTGDLTRGRRGRSMIH